MNALFGKTVNLLADRLDYRAKRHTVIVSNVSNIDTANFKPSDISFKNEFGKVDKLNLTTTSPGHIAPLPGPYDSVNYETTTSEDGVKVDTEMANLAENNLMYNATVEMLARKFRGLETVLKETK